MVLRAEQIYLPSRRKGPLSLLLVDEALPRSDARLFIIADSVSGRPWGESIDPAPLVRMLRQVAREVWSRQDATSTLEERFEQIVVKANHGLGMLLARTLPHQADYSLILGIWEQPYIALTGAGRTAGYLLRGENVHALSAGVWGGAVEANRVFPSFTFGLLSPNDTVILAAGSLFDVVALENIRRIRQERGKGALRAIAEVVKSNRDYEVSYGAFFCEVELREQKESAPKSVPEVVAYPTLSTPASQRQAKSFLFKKEQIASALGVLQTGIKAILEGIRTGTGKAVEILLPKVRIRMSPRQTMFFGALVLVVVALALTLGVYGLRKQAGKKLTERNTLIAAIEEKIQEADRSLIFKDDAAAAQSLKEAQDQLSALPPKSFEKSKQDELSKKINELSEKISRKTNVSPGTLASFPNTPTFLVPYPAGILGVNSNTNTVAVYDAGAKQVHEVPLTRRVDGQVTSGVYLPAVSTFYFFTDKGTVMQFEVSSGIVSPVAISSPSSEALGKIAAATAYGEPQRAYLLAPDASNIFVLGTGSDSLAGWLKSNADLKETIDLSIDGSIWVLSKSAVRKFLQGREQTFSLPILLEPLENAAAIFTAPDYQNLYLADPGRKRILIITKNGKLVAQLLSDEFERIRDLIADEKAKTIRALVGDRLVEIKF